MTGRIPTRDQVLGLRVPQKPHAPLLGFSSALLPAHHWISHYLPCGHWVPDDAIPKQAAAMPVEGLA